MLRHARVVKEQSWTMRVGEVCVLALGVSIFAAVPTALRTRGAGGSFFEGLLVGAAVLVPIVALMIALLRAAGRGLRGIVGPQRTRAVVLFIALWIGLSMPLLAILGAILKATTNHRGLGGATFGVVGLATALTSAFIAQRLVLAAQKLVARGVKPWIIAAAASAIGALPVIAVASPLARAVLADGAARHVQAAIIDGAIALVAAALVATFERSAVIERAAGTWGVPLGAVVVIAAAARVESSPTLGHAFRAGGGLAPSLLGALEDWTDRDHDGTGAHFGGSDCDEGDPSRRPGALEIPGDGIDQDCDGIDPPRAATSDIKSAEAKQASAPAARASAGAPGPATAGAGKADAKKRPDIVLITLDTVRADHTSAYGYPKPTTPNLEALAARGVLFERAYATGSDTQRALMPVISGRRLSATARDRREWPTVLPENDTLGERMKRAGYITAAVTSFTWLSEERGVAQGFDHFKTVYADAHPERDVTGPLATRAALSILNELASRAQPIFLWIHLFDAHERYLEHPGASFGKNKMALYDGEIAFVDEQIGQLREAVEKGSRGANTAWIVHGTQGEAFDEHGSTGHGAELYDEILRVPLVVALPVDARAAKTGRYDAGVVSTVDVAPTVLAIGGATSEGVEGESLLPILEGDFSRSRGPVYARAPKRAAVIDGALKLLVIERKKADRVLLFDLAADRAEAKDLSKDRPEDVARLLQIRSAFEAPEKQ